MTAPKLLGAPKRQQGIAGSYSYSVTVQYPGEEPTTLTFHGSSYGGPVVMETPGGQVFVRDPGRLGGTLSTEWVMRFLASA